MQIIVSPLLTLEAKEDKVMEEYLGVVILESNSSPIALIYHLQENYMKQLPRSFPTV